MTYLHTSKLYLSVKNHRPSRFYRESTAETMNLFKESVRAIRYPDEVIDRLARAFYPAILACWNSEEGQREFAAWQAEQAHHTTSKEKQSVPDGERPVVHIVIVCGLWQGASYSGTHPVFVLSLHRLFELQPSAS